MIAVSSFRPFTDPQSEYGRNQIAAHRSWQSAFNSIVYFNEFNPLLACPKTFFIEAEPFPLIRVLADFAANQLEWSAIINADIVIGNRWPVYERKLMRSLNACSAISYRYEFDPVRGLESGEVVDNGLDFFCANPAIWRQASTLIHPDLRIGCQSWDTQMLSFFCTYALHGFYDMTPARQVFHPKHDGRAYGPCVPPDQIPVWSVPVMPIAKIR